MAKARIEDDEGDDWDPGQFQDAIELNLRAGRFALFIVVDKINDELRRIVDFVNAKTQGELELYALEVKYFDAPSAQIVLPRIYGLTTRTKDGWGVHTPWTKERFFRHAQEVVGDKRTFELLRDLYDYFETRTDSLEWGKGNDAGRVMFRVNVRNAKRGFLTLFRLKSTGGLKMGFGRFPIELSANDQEGVARKLLDKLRELPVFDQWYKEDYLGKDGTIRRGWPGRNRPLMQVLSSVESVEKFKRALTEFIREMRGS